MLSYILALAASVDPSAGAAPAARIAVGGYVPASCRAPRHDPAAGAASLQPLCSGGASVSIVEAGKADLRLVRIVVSPR
ncbi:MAG TPA: hypothetical protein VF552_05800 [Allosphingosinicella sp.]|jgi:hypothetical protein